MKAIAGQAARRSDGGQGHARGLAVNAGSHIRRPEQLTVHRPVPDRPMPHPIC